MQFVGLLCKSDIMHICVLYGCVGVYKITYFSSNKVFCYRKKTKMELRVVRETIASI